MRWPDLKLARRFGRTSRDRLSLYLIGISAALLLPLLVFVVGLITHLVFGTDDAAVPTDWLIGPWVNGRIIDWPLFGSAQRCLFVLLAIGVMIGAIEVWALDLLNRAVHRAALDVVVRFYGEIHQQAFRLGSSDLLGGLRSPPEKLVGETADELHRGLVRWWSAVPYAVVAVGSLILTALLVNLWLTLVVLLAVVLVRQIYSVAARRFEIRAAQWEREAAAAHELLVNNQRLTPLATGYALADAPGRPFREILRLYRRAALKSQTYRSSHGPVLLLLTLLAVAYVLLVIGLSSHVTVAGTVVLTAALLGAYFPAARLYQLTRSLTAADRAAADLFAYLRREPAVRDTHDSVAIDRISRSVRLDQVTLASDTGVKLLDHVDLTIEAGTHVAILASELNASLALAGLLVRLYDPAAGRILFDDSDIATATLATVRGQSLLVPATGMLFDGSVSENISCGDAGFTPLQLTDAAKQARAYHFVMELPQGFSTHFGEGGTILNDSQAFRIGLARALLRDPSLLIVVEPPNDIDKDTENQLDEAMRLAASDRTMIAFPSRLSTLRAADKVIVLHEGKIDAEGTHTQLLKTNQLYRHLNYVRFHTFRDLR